MYIFISIIPIASPNPIFDHLLESSHQDDSNKWSNIRFGEEITQVVSILVYFTDLIWSSLLYLKHHSDKGFNSDTTEFAEKK